MSSRGVTRTGARRGVTLLELLLVMAVLGVALGAGVGMFATLDLGKRQAQGLVKNVLRSAQNSAIARQAPARVRIDVESGVMIAESMETVGTWHFERNSMRGAGGLEGGTSGGTLYIDDGFLGDALYLDGRVGSWAEIPIQLDPAFDFTDGFSIECALRREGTGGGKAIVVAGIAGLDIGNDGRIRGWFVPRLRDKGEDKPGGRILVETEPGVAISGRWLRIKLEYDRAALRIHVDGVPKASFPETTEVWKIERPMYLSGKDYPFHGSIDSLVVSCVAAAEEVPLPETVRFSPDTPTEVRFAAGGGLDRIHHPEPLILTLEFDDGAQKMLFVGTYGTVDG
ncbi:MAG: prepilin-type N-terminal cleavage/methylation domain-containing protein [Planctomycetota bacterium]